MIFHENCLLADNSLEISHLIFFGKLGKMLQNLSSAAVLIGALRVKALRRTRSSFRENREASPNIKSSRII